MSPNVGKKERDIQAGNAVEADERIIWRAEFDRVDLKFCCSAETEPAGAVRDTREPAAI